MVELQYHVMKKLLLLLLLCFSFSFATAWLSINPKSIVAYTTIRKGCRHNYCHTRTLLKSSISPLIQPPAPPPPPHLPTASLESLMIDNMQRSLSSLRVDIGIDKTKLFFSDVANEIEKNGSFLFDKIPSIQLQDITSLLDSSGFEQKIRLPTIPLQHFDKDIVALVSDLQSSLIRTYPASYSFIQMNTDGLSSIFPVFSFVASAVVTYILICTAIVPGRTSLASRPYPMNKYDAAASRSYFDRRPHVVLARALTIGVQSLQFVFSLLLDRVRNKLQENELTRGRELAALLTRLGPTFIKVGQSLSIRTDLISPAYVRGLETLQDQVPAFDTETAKQILETEWGRPITSVLTTDLSSKPIAAASLGQVYKARLLASNEEVAIKIQRPDIMEQIALDMYLIREIGGIIKQVAKPNTDILGTVDAWGIGFVDELDYIQEAANGQMFSELILDTPLRDVVFSPTVLNNYTTRSVLVTSWVYGERLDRSDAKDVSIICSIAMNTYLTMLLEFGLLHCDPHPGNLLRTPEGKLCIMDWGMVTRLDYDLQLTLIEHMAHLTSADYAELPRDLLLLGFVPEDKADVIGDSGVVEVLADIYSAWTAGGGAANINVNEVISQLQDLTAKKGNLFRIPPYFAYIAKSFSVLEGIGLSNDPNYSIINECLPYISKRLLTDSDIMGPALSTFIFGPEKSSKDRIINYRRVEQLIEGFGEYSTTTSGALIGKGNLSRSAILDDVAEQVLNLVFTEEETPLQEIVLEQLAKILSSSGRMLLTELRERSGILPSGRTRLGLLLDPLGLWRTSPLIITDARDEETVETTRKLVSLIQRQFQISGNNTLDLSKLTTSESLELSSILVQKVWSKRNGVLETTNRFARILLQLTADKLERGGQGIRRIPGQITLHEKNSNEESSSFDTLSNSQAGNTQNRFNTVRVSQSVQEDQSAWNLMQKNESQRLTKARKLLAETTNAVEM